MPSRLGVESLLFAALLITAWPTAVRAAYPAPVDPYVNDFAGRLSAAETQALRSVLQEARQATGVEATVVVVDSIRDYGTSDTSIESFATHLFNAWGIGDAERDDGILFLAALGGKVRIEIGAGYGAESSELMAQVLDRHVLPRFKAGQIGEGISAGVRATLAELTDWQPPVEMAPRSAVSTPAPNVPEPRATKGFRVGALLALIGLLVAVGAVAVGRDFYRHRPRRCPDCQSPMQRLDESKDDNWLASGQQAEENMGSVDYDVWKCSSCDYTTITAWRRWLSSYEACPACGYRTLHRTTRTLSEPTYSSSGLKEILSTCGHCHYSYRGEEVLAQLTRSTDSSDTSFSGGSSSGGGATGSW